jgi:K+-transporting ATPase ATPase C chain
MKNLAISLKIFVFFTIITGIAYPLLITGIAQLVFPAKANGSLISMNGKTVGSELIGQQFDSAIYFHSRPSAISYNPLPSGGSNYGLTNIKLKNQFDLRKNQFIEFNQLDSLTAIPSEMLFASASGLDPDISPEAAFLQANRIVTARNFNPLQKQQLLNGISELTQAPQFFCLGQKGINVLLLNLYVDQIK